MINFYAIPFANVADFHFIFHVQIFFLGMN